MPGAGSESTASIANDDLQPAGPRTTPVSPAAIRSPEASTEVMNGAQLDHFSTARTGPRPRRVDRPRDRQLRRTSAPPQTDGGVS